VLTVNDGLVHDSLFTNGQRAKEAIQKLDWPPNAPNFNPIEHIWTLTKCQIHICCSHEPITSEQQMKKVL